MERLECLILPFIAVCHCRHSGNLLHEGLLSPSVSVQSDGIVLKSMIYPFDSSHPIGYCCVTTLTSWHEIASPPGVAAAVDSIVRSSSYEVR